ncbi:MAG TPA: AtpZ/AtpI family protein [Phycisphaerae bacterium]|nr:AtpZ/AtpI family protein [Phycisphaerae bacterium]HNU45049.1 AtpZ/AtpI family protein [Phycisphaerae bacterium]
MAGESRKGWPWLRFSGLGVEFAAAVLGFTLVGYWIDRHYGCGPWGVVIGVALGLIGGMYNLVRQALVASREADERRNNGTNQPDP